MNKKFDDWLQQQLGLKTATPTYSAADVTEIGEARLKFDRAFENFLVEAEAWNDQHALEEEEEEEEDEEKDEDFAEEHTEASPPPVHAVRFHDRRRQDAARDREARALHPGAQGGR